MLEDHRTAREVSPSPFSVAARIRPTAVWVLRLGRLLLLAVAFGLRVVSLDAQGVWRDEVDQWRFAFQPVSEQLRNFLRPGWNGPLYSPLLRIWIEVAGDSVFAMRLLSAFWGLLGVTLAIVVAHRLSGRRVALMTGLLMALSPYMIWYSQEIKMYTWVPMLVLLALYALDRACQTPRWTWWLIVFTATTLGVYSHILAALLIPVLAFWCLLHPRRHPRAWQGITLVLGGLTLPYLPLLVWQWSLVWQIRQTGYPDFTLAQMASALLNGWSTGVSQGAWATRTVTLLLVLGTTALAVAGVFWLARHRGWRRAGQLLLWLVLPLIGVWAVSLRGPIFTDRYLIWLAPAFYVLMSAGLLALSRVSSSVGAIFVALLVTISLHGWWVQSTVPFKPQFEAAVQVVEARRQDGDLLVFQIPYNHYVFSFYASDGLGEWVEAPYTNWREADGNYSVDSETVGRQMGELTAGYNRVWLVYSEARLWDDRELVRHWLEAMYGTNEVLSFHGVSLLLFDCATK